MSPVILNVRLATHAQPGPPGPGTNVPGQEDSANEEQAPGTETTQEAPAQNGNTIEDEGEEQDIDTTAVVQAPGQIPDPRRT